MRFDDETWQQLPDFLEKLPEPVQLHIWGDAAGSAHEQEAARVGQLLAERFAQQIECHLFPRRVNYPFYPVIGVMGVQNGEPVDYGVRLIGLPAGYQMTSLIAALQVVSFRGMTLEPMSRVKLSRLQTAVTITILTDAADTVGSLVAKNAFGMAVASPHVRTYLIMTDAFPEAIIRYSANYIPHTVINERVHVDGMMDEAAMLKYMATAVR